MVNDMVQIKIAVEGMKAEIVKAFDVARISDAIKDATEKAVEEFDIENYIKATVERVFDLSRTQAIANLVDKYSFRWENQIEALVDSKIEQALAASKGEET